MAPLVISQLFKRRKLSVNGAEVTAAESRGGTVDVAAKRGEERVATRHTSACLQFMSHPAPRGNRARVCGTVSLPHKDELCSGSLSLSLSAL